MDKWEVDKLTVLHAHIERAYERVQTYSDQRDWPTATGYAQATISHAAFVLRVLLDANDTKNELNDIARQMIKPRPPTLCVAPFPGLDDLCEEQERVS